MGIAVSVDEAQVAQHHLELAVEVALELGSAVTEWELAEHYHRLGRVLWANGGLDRKKVRTTFDTS